MMCKFVLLSLLFVCTWALHPERTRTFNVSGDTYFKRNQYNTNLGLSSTLELDRTTNAVIQFDYGVIPPCLGLTAGHILDPCYTAGFDPEWDTAWKAKVTVRVLHAVNGTGGSVSLAIYPSIPFNEQTADWDCADPELISDACTKCERWRGGLIPPKPEPTDVADIPNDSTDIEVEFKVTRDVNRGVSSWAIRIINSGKNAEAVLASRENLPDNHPRLEITDAAINAIADVPDTGCEVKFATAASLNVSYIHCPYTGPENSQVNCVLFHGAPTCKWLWRDMVRYIQPVCEVYAVDMIGHCDSENPEFGDPRFNHTYQLNEQSRVFEEFINNVLELENVALLGQDWGGQMISNYALDNPDNVFAMFYGDGVQTLACSPEAEEEGTCHREAIFTGHGFPGLKEMWNECIHKNTVVDPVEGGCGDYIQDRVWFYNDSLATDPKLAPGGTPGSVLPLGVHFYPFALPVEYQRDIIQFLTFDLVRDEVSNIYHKQKYLANPELARAMRFWQKQVYFEVPVPGQHHLEVNRQKMINFNNENLPGGTLADVPVYIMELQPGGITGAFGPREQWYEYIRTEYSKVFGVKASRGGGHFFPEDDTGAQDFGKKMARLIRKHLN